MRPGRLWATRQLCTIWIVGVIIFITSNGRYGQVLAGRFIMGLGIGQTTVVAPTYLAEAAPRSIRGLCICIFSGSVYLGIMLGYFANWGTSLHISNNTADQWIDATILHIIFAGIIIIMSFFALESPRWLAKVGRDEKAAANMSKLRKLPEDHPYVRSELIDIHDQLEREREATLGAGLLGPLKELFFLPGNRYRILLGLGCQLLGRKFSYKVIYQFPTLTTCRMVWRAVYHHLRTSILRNPWGYWFFGEAFCNRHIWCRKIRIRTHLCFLPCGLHRPKTLLVAWNHHSIHCNALHRHFSDSSSHDHDRKSSIQFTKARWNGSNRHDLLLRRRLGFGLEFDPVPHWSRNLPTSSSFAWHIYDHVFPFRKPVWKHKSCATNAYTSVTRLVAQRNILVLLGSDASWIGVRVVLLA